MKERKPSFQAPGWLWPGILFLAAIAMPCFGQAPVTNGLVARWSGNGNANDSAGHSDGQVAGGLRYSPGPMGQAFQFNGGDAQVDFGNTIGNFGARDFTIAFWLKTDSKNQHESLLSKRASCDASQSFWHVQVGSGVPRLAKTGFIVLAVEAGGSQPWYDLVSSHPMNDGKWHYIVWVRQSTSSGSSTGLIYVDGALDNSIIYPDTIDLSNQADLVLGHNVCECCDGCRPYSGAAADLQIFSHALSAEEILAIYNAGKSAK